LREYSRYRPVLSLRIIGYSLRPQLNVNLILI